MTEAEKREATKGSVLDGLWKAGTVFGPFFCVMFLPSPLNWICGIGILAVGLSFLPLWRKMVREFLCTTAWVRQHGITPDQLKGFGGATTSAVAAPPPAESRGRIAQWYARHWGTALFRNLALVVVIAWVLRAFVIGSYRAETDAVSPEIPRGSWMLVYKLARTFEPGDILAYWHEGKVLVGRVAEVEPRDGVVRVQRRQAAPESLAAANIIGKVVFNTRAGTSTSHKLPAQAAGKQPTPQAGAVPNRPITSRQNDGGGVTTKP